MPEAQLTLILAVAGAVLASGVVTFLVMRTVYGSRMGEISARLDKVEKSRARSNEMLMQARRQTETLQKELVQLRRPRGSAPDTAEAQAKLDAQAEALRRAKELMDEGDKTIVLNQRPTHFAETQPLSGFGPNIR